MTPLFNRALHAYRSRRGTFRLKANLIKKGIPFLEYQSKQVFLLYVQSKDFEAAAKIFRQWAITYDNNKTKNLQSR
jgi:hypothetical protein